jgi:peptidoglycan/LPS O-acetylase OafA/YrhL
MVFLGTYSYGLYVYHHFISYYLTINSTELELARWLGSHGAAVALQATLGASLSLAVAYLSYELFEKRFLRLKRLFQTAKEPTAHPSRPAAALECRAVAQLAGDVSKNRALRRLSSQKLRPNRADTKP